MAALVVMKGTDRSGQQDGHGGVGQVAGGESETRRWRAEVLVVVMVEYSQNQWKYLKIFEGENNG